MPIYCRSRAQLDRVIYGVEGRVERELKILETNLSLWRVRQYEMRLDRLYSSDDDRRMVTWAFGALDIIDFTGSPG